MVSFITIVAVVIENYCVVMVFETGPVQKAADNRALGVLFSLHVYRGMLCSPLSSFGSAGRSDNLAEERKAESPLSDLIRAAYWGETP